MANEKKIFRINEWWKGKAAQLMGLVYVLSLWFQIPFSSFVSLSILSIITIVGFAAFGHLVNDFFDIEQDKAAGKSNIFQNRHAGKTFLLFSISLSAMLVPWVFLPKNWISIGLIIFQIVLFFLYSAPYVRLKEKGIAALIVDALYAHVIPSVLATYTFILAAERLIEVLPFFLLIGWQMLIGVRNIFLHQFDDIEADTNTGNYTYVASMNQLRFHSTIHYLKIAELICAAFFFSIIALQLWIFGVISLLCVLSLGIYIAKLDSKLSYYNWKYFPNFVYESWLCLVVLCLLTVVDVSYLAVLLFHLVLFEWSTLVLVCTSILHFVKRNLSRIVNYTIFYFLLLWGVNLKKEKMSAWEYFKKWRASNAKNN